MPNRPYLKASFILIVWGLFTPRVSHAYIEPGMATVLWQLLLGGLIGASFFFHKIRFAITRLIAWLFSSFRKKKPASKASPDQQDNPPE